MNRLYSSAGQFVDAPTWEAIFNHKTVHAADYFTTHSEGRQDFHAKWLGRLGYAHSISAPLTSPVLAGFPGAIIALGSMGQTAFTDASIAALTKAAEGLSQESEARFQQRVSRDPSAKNRLFVAVENGRFRGGSPRDLSDPVLAGHLEAYAKTRLAQDKPTSAGDREQLLDSRNETRPFTVSYFPSYPAISTGRVLIMTAVPHYSEWLELTPADFSADAEIGRLLPAFKFMSERFHDGATLPTIASHIHLSPFHFHRRFTELLGITPKHFLFDCQIAEAEQLLLAGTHELEEIAKMCGFAHQSHFTSRFKQATGLTPTRWRKLHLSRGRDETSLERAHAV